MTEPAPSFLPPYWDRAAPRPRFTMGKRVRVSRGAPIGHCRTPWWARGRSGVIERVVGHFADPAALAYGRRNAQTLALYRVRFALSDIWPDRGDGYADIDTIDAEIYEPWLAPFFDYSDLDGEKARLEAELSRGA